jgi:hypothetical protein
MVILVAAFAWFSVVLVAVALCRAAAAGDTRADG